MKLEDIEEAILQLSPGDLAKLRLWFAEFESGMGAPKIAEKTAVKLGRIAGRTVAEWRKLSREFLERSRLILNGLSLQHID